MNESTLGEVSLLQQQRFVKLDTIALANQSKQSIGHYALRQSHTL